MVKKKEIIERIVDLEVKNAAESDVYLDEGEQAILSTLYWVLDDPLSSKTEELIQKRREEGR